MKRVCIVGCGGSGKSTFARQLAALNNLPLYHLDTIFYRPGWVEEDREIFEQKLNHWLMQDQWILDGNFVRTAALRFTQGDTVFYLDFPVTVSLWGAITRLINNYGQTRPDMAEGCKESLDWGFLLHILRWRWQTRPKLLKALEESPQNCQIITFKSRKDVQNWLKAQNVTH